MKEVRVLAPAKVNLDLEVLGRREDGFHELRTTMLLVGLADELRLKPTKVAGVHLKLGGPALGEDMPRDSSNLAVAALEQGLAALKQAGEEVPGVELELIKRIPSGAGLGGGSSDAAAALHGLQELLGAQITPEVTQSILAGLGSDCVFFQAARSTGLGRCSGRGELVEPLEAPKAWWIVLVTPDVFASTPRVFLALDAPPFKKSAVLAEDPVWSRLSAEDARALQHNDLQGAALRAIPELRAWRDLLDRNFVLSGSGASFYSLCADQAEAENLLQTVRGACERGGHHPRFLEALPLA
jgi:4-diphosphocytidyl-2-C-methyl-D-erythritol kinase